MDASALASPARRAKSPARKGRQTKASILNAAMQLAAHVGLEGLSIGSLAEQTGMSKSGVFAHFGSREDLQLAVIAHYHDGFQNAVFLPALQEPAGLPRLRGMVRRWMERMVTDEECGLYISGAVDFDDRPGAVRQALMDSVRTWMSALRKAAVLSQQAGHLRSDMDLDQLVFEIHGLVLALYYDRRFMRSEHSLGRAMNGLDRLLQDACAPGTAPRKP